MAKKLDPPSLWSRTIRTLCIGGPYDGKIVAAVGQFWKTSDFRPASVDGRWQVEPATYELKTVAIAIPLRIMCDFWEVVGMDEDDALDSAVDHIEKALVGLLVERNESSEALIRMVMTHAANWDH